MPKETAKLLEDLDTGLGELGEVVEEALNKYFEEEYEVKKVDIDEEGLILVSINLLEDADEE